jgi:pantetheine-phosphate adenylyltransferase
MSERLPRIAFYPGSFDPWTNGHMFLLRMGLTIFDGVIVVVAVNPNKSYVFESWERMNMIRDVVRQTLPSELSLRVKVIETDTYVGEVSEKYGADFFLRGIRDAKDAQWELEVADINQKLFPKMQTVMLHAPPSMSWMSSSFVKKLIAEGESVSQLVHPEVEALTRLRMKAKTSTQGGC